MAVTPNLGLTLQAVDDTYVEDYIIEQAGEGEGTVASPLSNMQKIDLFAGQVQEGKLDNESLYPAFSTSGTYAVGNIVTYGGFIWVCHTAVAAVGPWSGATNWTKTALPTILLNKVVDQLYSEASTAGYSGAKSAFLADLAALSGLATALEGLL